MDPISLGTAASASKAVDATSAEAAKVAGNLLTRLLGPSADLVGAQWAEALRQKNLARLLRKAEKRAEGEQQPGIANPRLASQVFEAAQFADDEVVAEYLSGVLASSRDAEGRNDSGVAWSAVVNRLSSDQLKLHYLIYASTRDALLRTDPNHTNDLNGVEILLDLGQVLQRMEISTSTDFYRFADAVDGLMREGLIGDGYSYGAISHVSEASAKLGAYLVPPFDPGLRVVASIHGIRLFLWGMGLGRGAASQFIDRSVIIEPSEEEAALELVRAGTYKEFWSEVVAPAVENVLVEEEETPMAGPQAS